MLLLDRGHIQNTVAIRAKYLTYAQNMLEFIHHPNLECLGGEELKCTQGTSVGKFANRDRKQRQHWTARWDINNSHCYEWYCARGLCTKHQSSCNNCSTKIENADYFIPSRHMGFDLMSLRSTCYVRKQPTMLKETTPKIIHLSMVPIIKFLILSRVKKGFQSLRACTSQTPYENAMNFHITCTQNRPKIL